MAIGNACLRKMADGYTGFIILNTLTSSGSFLKSLKPAIASRPICQKRPGNLVNFITRSPNGFQITNYCLVKV